MDVGAPGGTQGFTPDNHCFCVPEDTGLHATDDR
jgi:hypothetical protein